MIAIDNGHTDIARVLVDKGADLNMVDKVRKYSDCKSCEIIVMSFMLFNIYYSHLIKNNIPLRKMCKMYRK